MKKKYISGFSVISFLCAGLFSLAAAPPGLLLFAQAEGTVSAAAEETGSAKAAQTISGETEETASAEAAQTISGETEETASAEAAKTISGEAEETASAEAGSRPAQEKTSALAAGTRVCAILPHRSDVRFWTEVESGIRAGAQAHSFSLTVLYSSSDDETVPMDMAQAVHAASLMDTQGLIISYVNPDEETDSLLRQIRSAGVPVVVVDSDTEEPDLRDSCVSLDNRAAGEALAKTALQNLETGQSAVLFVDQSTESRENIADRISGIEQAFAESSASLTVLHAAAGTEVEWSLQLEAAMKEHPDIRAILTVNERMTLLAARLISSLELSEPVRLYGFDRTDQTTKLMEDGVLTALIAQNPYQMGYQSTDTAASLLTGEKPGEHVAVDFTVEKDDSGT